MEPSPKLRVSSVSGNTTAAGQRPAKSTAPKDGSEGQSLRGRAPAPDKSEGQSSNRADPLRFWRSRGVAAEHIEPIRSRQSGSRIGQEGIRHPYCQHSFRGSRRHDGAVECFQTAVKRTTHLRQAVSTVMRVGAVSKATRQISKSTSTQRRRRLRKWSPFCTFMCSSDTGLECRLASRRPLPPVSELEQSVRAECPICFSRPARLGRRHP